MATVKTVTKTALSFHSKRVLEVAQNSHNFQLWAQQTWNLLRTSENLRNITDQMNPGESYDPLLISAVISTSISVDEGDGTG